jgi:hypothetical protein
LIEYDVNCGHADSLKVMAATLNLKKIIVADKVQLDECLGTESWVDWAVGTESNRFSRLFAQLAAC